MIDQRRRSATVELPPDWDVAKAWIDGLRAKSRKTASAYADAINGFLQFVNKPVADITVEDALEYVGHLGASGPSRTSFKHEVSAIRSFVRHCQRLGLAAPAPLDGMKTLRATGTSMNRYVPQDEVERLLAAAKDLLNQHPLGRLGRISIVIGTALPILLWIFGDGKTVLGLLVLLVSVPLWMAGVRALLCLGQWMLTEPEGQRSHRA